MSSFWNSPAWSMGTRSNSKNKGSVVNPGPGNYNSSGNITKHYPSWKIGGALRDGSKMNQNPGPGQYNLGNGKSGPKITISSKGKVNSLDGPVPGPGNYNVNNDGVYKNPSAFTMGAKYGSKIEDPEPGPGNYNVKSDMKLTGAKIGKSKRGGLGSENEVPGPGMYGNSRPFSAGPKYGFGNELKAYRTMEGQPGPGQYEVNENTFVKGCRIGQKFNKKDFTYCNPGPGSYELSSKRPMSGAKIGKSERGKQGGNVGPGPGAYEQGYKMKGTTEVKIGSGQRSNFGKADTPGPGAYEVLKNARKGVTISGFKSKYEIQVTPGPGTYEVLDGAQRPCSAKIGRSKRSNLTGGETPGPGQYFPKDKNQYHFAYSKEPRSKDLKGGDPGPGQYEIPATVPSAPQYLIDPSVYKASYG